MDLYLEEQLQAYWEGIHNLGSATISRKKKKKSLILQRKGMK